MYYIASTLFALFLKLRYRVRLHGVEKIKKNDKRGLLFLPNHPALIDPIILGSFLVRKFHPYILLHDEQVNGTALKHFVKKLKLLPIGDPAVEGNAIEDKVREQFIRCREALKRGENVWMYPSGHAYSSRYENLRGNSGTFHLLQACPDARVILIRTTGLWGSSFSRCDGVKRPFPEIAKSKIKYFFTNFLFFMPRRHVDITFEEVADLPLNAGKDALNRHLENFYNLDAPPNTYVPYSIWESGTTRTVAEPPSEFSAVDTSAVPNDVRQKVYARLREVSSVAEIHDQDKLGKDLGMDSLLVYGSVVWVEQTFGQRVSNPGSIHLVGDLLLAAIGQTQAEEALKPIPVSWFIPENPVETAIPRNCRKITETFLVLAKRQPDFPLLADQSSGVLTNRKIILAILALKNVIEKVPGDRVGIILPACAAFFPVFMATLYAGKTPVLFNWTVGARSLAACAKKSGVQHILSSKLVIQKLAERGTDFSPVEDSFLFLEDLKKEITPGMKLLALLRSRFSWRVLRKANVPENVAIIFTSGSESEPKAVPVTHWNGLQDIEYSMTPMHLRRDDSIIGMLPPFHSFGLLINGILPALTNIRIIYHSDPTDGNMLKRLITAYRASMIVGTPTFAEGILKDALPEEVETIRIIITGAEKCPANALALFRQKCPRAYFLEGYGITECGPIVAVNEPEAMKLGTVGKILGCTSWMICDPDGNPLPPNTTGMLYVSGPTVFPGYLGYDGVSPFVEKAGKTWYRTGDLVQADEEGFITFMGRLKRFIKVAGEMVSLPAVETALLAKFGKDAKKIPLAVEAQGPDNAPEIILFATIGIDKDAANQALREAGFSPIHYIRKVVQLEEIPLLGTGKTDYKQLKTIEIQKKTA